MKKCFTLLLFCLLTFGWSDVWGQGCTEPIPPPTPPAPTTVGACTLYEANDQGGWDLVCCTNLTVSECYDPDFWTANGANGACWTNAASCGNPPPPDCVISLPVELISWTGAAMPHTNKLKWTTASEENTAAFIIERSGNGRTGWQEVGRVNAIGFSSAHQEYAFVDESPFFVGYYRLRIVDFDGTYEFSGLIVVERDRKILQDVLIAPNPVEDAWTRVSFTSDTDRKALILLSDVKGNTLLSRSQAIHKGINAFDLDLADLPEGVYFLRIEMPDGVIGKKIVLMSKK